MVAWFTSLLVAAAAPSPSPAASGPRCIQLIGTSDVHGHLEAEELHAGPLAVQRGGLPGFAAYLHILREKYPHQVLLLDGGDLFQGTVPSNYSKGAAVIAAYNAMGYDAVALGNHEFDFGPEGQEKDLLGAIKTRLREAHFPVLAANVYEAKSEKRAAWKDLEPSVLLSVDGVKVGVIGAITPETPLVTVPLNVESLDFHEPAADVAAEAQRQRKAGAQVVVLTTHIGGACKVVTNPDDLSSCQANSELFALLHALPAGTLDAVIAGHTHQYIAQNVEGVAVSEAGYYGHSFGWIELCVEGKTVTKKIHPPTDVCLSTWAEGGCGEQAQSAGVKPATFLGEAVAPDPAIQKVIDPYLAKVKAFQEAQVGVEVAQPVNRAHDKTSPLGVLVAEAIRSAVPRAQIGLTNAGGVRADLPAGRLIYKQVFEVLPFDNRVVGLRLTGKELNSFIMAPLRAGHGFPQLAGARLIIDDAARKEGHLELSDGSRVVEEKEYLLATNDFLANGGDGAKPVVSTLPKDRRTSLNTLVRDAFIDYLKKQPQPIQAPQVP
jgi:5'-nucleotidase